MAHSPYTFPYRFIDDTKFPRPYIPITLRNQKQIMQPMLALVDSGADFSVFDSELSLSVCVLIGNTTDNPSNGILGVPFVIILAISVTVLLHRAEKDRWNKWLKE